ncbi:hypothetical protein KORDIASMS9_02246 [Kordia sp. SMS9]|uniref:hypothetical protein n=1 Tax=Kordia sp. SMS9 TaxID=2282170 RepID=UPI000E0FFB7C|nr:hypothetical protein [Kordia sp. SMS9]AXG70017.1 hypothetical protein KORDIASMS9_02246 [Kordia sp. SMS9]
MKKGILLVASILAMFLCTNCEPNNLAEDEIEFQATDKKDSVNSNGGPNPKPSNEEE